MRGGGIKPKRDVHKSDRASQQPRPLQIPRERKKLEIEVENDLWLRY